MALIRIGAKEETLPEGFYEVYMAKADKANKTNPAYESSRIMWKVRDDLESMADFAGKNIFANIRTSWDWLFSAIGHAVKIPADTEFEDLDEFLEGIKGLSCKVKVTHTYKDDSVFANIKGYYESDEHTYIAPVADGEGSTDNSII